MKNILWLQKLYVIWRKNLADKNAMGDMNMLEKEYKLLLSKENYLKLEKIFRFEDEYTQINFFYKENENLHLDTTIRVRAKKEKLFLQVKEPIEKKKGRHIKKEYQKELGIVPYKIEGNALNSLCETDIYEDCFLLGVLITDRKILKLEKCEIALDINYYDNTVDYVYEFLLNTNSLEL